MKQSCKEKASEALVGIGLLLIVVIGGAYGFWYFAGELLKGLQH